MVKFKRIGYVGVPKKDASKRYIKITEDVQLKKDSFLSMLKPKQGEKMSDEDFAALCEWKRFDILLVTED